VTKALEQLAKYHSGRSETNISTTASEKEIRATAIRDCIAVLDGELSYWEEALIKLRCSCDRSTCKFQHLINLHKQTIYTLNDAVNHLQIFLREEENKHIKTKQINT